MNRWGVWPLVLSPLLACASGARPPQASLAGPPPEARVLAPAPDPPGDAVGAPRAGAELPAAAYPTMRLRHDILGPFANEHPNADGRGVLIGVLDSGIDPSVPGLQFTTDGKRKLLDLRDLSGEGRIELTRIMPRNDSLSLHGQHLGGAARAMALASDGAIWAGILAETPLGAAPAADLDGNGVVGDSLMVLVVRGRAGWLLLADTARDGTLTNDTGVRDFGVAGESFGWSTDGEPSPLHLAINFGEENGTPTLDLLFDTSGHGTHVAGIAAGYQIGGYPSLHGVAPGAQLIGVKIANNRHGGLSVSGSMLRGLDYLIRAARARQMPLVVNLSLGVANVVGRPARIDAVLDSALAANPDIVMTIAAGNDGPGLATIGFPSSTTRALAVGAVDYAVPAATSPGPSRALGVSSFSGRGGSIAGPDILVPGEAYSTVPDFARGEEVVGGTSMAAPFAAGMVARLISAQSGSPVVATDLITAMRRGAIPFTNVAAIDQGAGVASLTGALRVLLAHPNGPRLAVDVGAVIGRGAVLFGQGDEHLISNARRVVLRRLDNNTPMLVRLRASAPWIRVPEVLSIQADGASFTVVLDAEAMPRGGDLSEVIEVRPFDGSEAIFVAIPVTVVQPALSVGGTTLATTRITPGTIRRIFFTADSGRGFQVALARDAADARISARLFEPGGRPFRAPSAFSVERSLNDAPTVVDAADVVPGTYELVLFGDSASTSTVTVRIMAAPVRLTASLIGNDIRLAAQNLMDTAVSVRFRVGLKGAETSTSIRRDDDRPVRLAYPIPQWAARVTLDSWMPEAQWSRFTDMGVTFEARDGQQLGVFPMNFPYSRAILDFTDRMTSDSLVVWIAPGFPERSGSGTWDLELRLRYELRPEVAIDPGGSPPRVAPRRGTAVEVFPMRPAIPTPIPKGFDPVVQVVAIDADRDWWRIIRLGSSGGREP